MPSLLLCLDVCLLVTLIDVSLGQQYRTAPSLRTLLRTDTTTATLAPSEVSRMRSEVSALTHEVKELRNQLKQVKRQSYAMYLVLKENTRSCDQCRTEQDNDVASECAPGFELATPSSCYHLDNDAVTWEEANERCATIGGALVAIETDDEQDFVVKTIKQSKDMNHCDVWTAGTDRDREGVWEWSARNEPIVYTAWHRNEPNNGHVGEHCLLLDWFYGWEWNDVRCDAIRACYICEFEL